MSSAAPKPAKKWIKRLPIENWNRPLHEKGDDAIEALARRNDPPTLFVLGGKLTRIRQDENGRSIAETLSVDMLKNLLSRAAIFTDVRGTEIAPPQIVAKDVFARGEWPEQFPRLMGVTQIPILAPDGTVTWEPGYDPVTDLVYCPPPGLNIPRVAETPSIDSVQKAREILEDILCDFPFDSQASLANAMAMIITPAVRHAIDDLVPIAINDAPQAGTGKTKLAGSAALIATGHPAGNMVAPSNDEEWRKRITSTLRAANPVIIIDNLEGRLEAAPLASVLTSKMWEDRNLGVSENLWLPNRATWIATGNNVQIGGDLGRRCYFIRLDAKTRTPYLRTGFKYPDLEAHILRVRGELIWAILTLCRSWFAAGQPPGPNPVIGSFEKWSRTVGGILANAGISGFLGNWKTGEPEDAETAEWSTFLQTIYEVCGGDYFFIGEMLNELRREEKWFETLPEEFENDGLELNRRLGNAFAEKQYRRFPPNDYRIERGSDLHGKAKWRICCG